MKIEIYDINGRLVRAINPTPNSNVKVFEGTADEYKAAGWDKKIAQNAKEQSKPVASGKDLIGFINNATVSELTDQQALAVINNLKDFLLFMEQGRCNPLSKETLQFALGELDKAFQKKKEKALIQGLVDEWTKTVVFK